MNRIINAIVCTRLGGFHAYRSNNIYRYDINTSQAVVRLSSPTGPPPADSSINYDRVG